MDIITLLDTFVRGLLKAEENFLGNLGAFPEFEESVSTLSNKIAADFIGKVLTTADQMIRDSSKRKGKYTIQRSRQRTLISSVGDISFSHTLYKDCSGKTRCLLDEMLRLPKHERFTTIAEAKILSEAEVHSYRHAADSIKTNAQTITKVAVMNKVHAISEDVARPEAIPEEKKKCKYLYIEADEDHIHRQREGDTQGCFIGKLVYLFEGKEDVCKGRRKLIAPHYFGGIYSGTGRNTQLWETVDAYIREHYDIDFLDTVYINSDGAGWIHAAADYVYKSKLVADRFHLMKGINKVARYTDDENETKGWFYRHIHKNRLAQALGLLSSIKHRYDGSSRAVDELVTYFKRNWEYIQRAFHDKNVIGCSAEGHVSSVYSERMSSRPMGWSERGSDRMCRLRCYIRNYGRGKVIDLVKYRRERETGELAATGTDGIIDSEIKKRYTDSQKNVYKYAQWLHGTLSESSTVRKTLAIREQIGNL